MPVPMAQTGCNALVSALPKRRRKEERTDLVRDDDELPVSGVDDDLGSGGELASDDLDGLARLALLEVLSNAEDHVDANLEGGLGLRERAEVSSFLLERRERKLAFSATSWSDS